MITIARSCQRAAAAICAAITAAVLTHQVAYAQAGNINAVRDLPRTTELEALKQQIASQPRPVDTSSLYNEIQRLQFSRQRLSELRSQRSAIDSTRERLEAGFTDLTAQLSDLATFCKNAQNADDVNYWWRTRVFDEYVRTVQVAAEAVGATADRLTNGARPAKPGETCQQYTPEIRTLAGSLQKSILDMLSRYQLVEQEKLKSIPELDTVYKGLSDRMTQDLETARQRQQENTATSIAEKLWARAGDSIHHRLAAADRHHGARVVGVHQGNDSWNSSWWLGWLCALPGCWSRSRARGQEGASG
jgi:hypothetical protein